MMEQLLLHWGLEGGGSKVFRVSENGTARIVRRYSYMDFDENDDEIWRQGEIEHPSFDAFWQEATVNKKWFSRHPVYIHDECKTIIRRSRTILIWLSYQKMKKAISMTGRITFDPFYYNAEQ